MPEKVSYIKKHLLTSDELVWEMLLGGWSKQGEDKILEELQSAVKRNEIDSNILMLNFLRAPSAEIEKSMSDKCDAFQVRNQTLFNPSRLEMSSNVEACDENGRSIFGIALLHDLLERYRDSSSMKGMLFPGLYSLFYSRNYSMANLSRYFI